MIVYRVPALVMPQNTSTLLSYLRSPQHFGPPDLTSILASIDRSRQDLQGWLSQKTLGNLHIQNPNIIQPLTGYKQTLCLKPHLLVFPTHPDHPGQEYNQTSIVPDGRYQKMDTEEAFCMASSPLELLSRLDLSSSGVWGFLFDDMNHDADLRLLLAEEKVSSGCHSALQIRLPSCPIAIFFLTLMETGFNKARRRWESQKEPWKCGVPGLHVTHT
jgi:hypothetical protein